MVMVRDMAARERATNESVVAPPDGQCYQVRVRARVMI